MSRRGVAINRPMKLSTDLAAIIGMDKGSRGECIKGLWAYIKTHKLQDPENKQYFTPDRKMAKVFGPDKLRCFSMAKYLNEHLTNIDQ